MIILRSLAFNMALFGWTALMCFLMMWAFLLPRKQMIWVVHLWLKHIAWMERNIAGIHYRVIGLENVPAGSCIIAAKHQSAWETFKLHLLFGDPAIVLKQELLNIPIWGWYVRKAKMIPINRSGQLKAIAGMIVAAEDAVKDGRKIVIFPQGTRLAPGEFRPYKSGVSALYQELNIPLVPMALNSGLFWPKHGFLKKPGTITVEFLPAIPPGVPRTEMMERLQKDLESVSDDLAFNP